MDPGIFSDPSYQTIGSGSEEDNFGSGVDADGVTHFGKNDAQKAANGQKTAVYGYNRDILRTFFFWVCVFCSCGLLRLVVYWVPRWMLLGTHVRCPLRRARKLLIIETNGKHVEYWVKDAKELIAESPGDEGDVLPLFDTVDDSANLGFHKGRGIFQEVHSIRMFTYKKIRYIWDDYSSLFKKLPGLDLNVTARTLFYQSGLSARQQKLRGLVYGTNDIPVPVMSIIKLLCLEILTPFYVFRLFSLCLWFWDKFNAYPTAKALLTIFKITTSIIRTRKDQKKLLSSVPKPDFVTVVRGDSGQHEIIPSNLLVPGDVFIVPSDGCAMHCDSVLLTGKCIVDESMLTGESVPVCKIPLPKTDELYDVKVHSRSTLFCGTQVMRARCCGAQFVYALVLRTGFSTAKGNLVRSIMYPRSVDFKFERDSYRLMAALALIGSVGFAYIVITMYLDGAHAWKMIIEALDLITVLVPPTLPAAMAVGRMCAQGRLNKKGIFCTNPRLINLAGSTDCVCFDKTGTLTDDYLYLRGVVANNEPQPPIRVLSQMHPCHLLWGLVTCHSLTFIEEKLSGDPLDLKMFESTEWQLEEPDDTETSEFDVAVQSIVTPKTVASESQVMKIGIVRQMPFNSALQRMSVITKTLGDDEFMMYCKGSPEMIISLSLPETVPEGFNRIIEEYASEGHRVLALGYKPLENLTYPEVHGMDRDLAERDLIFLGLVIFENKMKLEAIGVINELREADIKTIMVTGDSLSTAMNVARDCGIVPPGKRVIAVQCALQADGTHSLSFIEHFSPPHILASSREAMRSAMTTTSVSSLLSAQTDSATVLGFFPSSASRMMPEFGSEYVFAVSGSSWKILRECFEDLVPRILTRGAVFARVSPDQKQEIIEELKDLGYHVAMCGDGANGCGALQAAHTGVSRSDTENSITSAFSSKQANISCIPTLVREGRAAIVTTFAIFKFMAAYALCQFASVLILYSVHSTLTDIQYVTIELFIFTPISAFFGKAGTNFGNLSRIQPSTNLVSLTTISSIILQLLVVIAVQVSAFFEIQNQEWFLPAEEARNCTDLTFSLYASYENYAIFLVSSFQNLILAFVFFKGLPYRIPFFLNFKHITAIMMLAAFFLYLTIWPQGFLQSVFELAVPKDVTYRWEILKYPLLNFLLACVIEHSLIDFLLVEKIQPRFFNIYNSKKKYLILEDEMKANPTWFEAEEQKRKMWTVGNML